MKKYWLLSFASITLVLIGCQNNANETKTPPQADQSTRDTTAGHLENMPAESAENQSAPVAPNRLIVPGKSIGQTALNMKADTVNLLLGPGDKTDAAMGKAWAIWYGKPTAPDTIRKETTLYFKTNMGGPDESSRVKQIRVTSAFFKTAANLGVGSNLTELKKAYPQLSQPQIYTSDQTKRSLTILDDKATGIAFEINPDNTCTAVVVHEPQEPVNTTYIHLFPQE